MIKRFFCFMVMALFLAGCLTGRHSDLTITVNKRPFKRVGTLELTLSRFEFMGWSGGFNLFNLTAGDMDPYVIEKIKQAVRKAGGDAAVDVTITQIATFTDMLINIFTCALFSPIHYRITGQIVKYAEPG